MSSKIKSKTLIFSLFLGLLTGVSIEKSKELAKFIGDKFSNENNTIEFLPVKLGSDTGNDGIQFQAKTYLPLEKKPITVNNASFSKGQSNLKELKKWSKKYSNHKMAVLVNGDIVSVPNLRNATMGEGFELIVKDPHSFDRVLNGLIN